MTMGGKAVLIDGNSLFHRAYYALPAFRTSEGQPTNAVYGFVSMLLRLLDEENPQFVAVAMDKGRLTFRHEEYAAYKAHRKAMPEELASQLPLLKAVLEAMKIPVVEKEGYEADDLLGVLARRFRAAGCQVLLVSGDRDVLQLVDEGIEAMITRRGISEVERWDVEAVRGRYGIEPGRLPDLKALMGDPSDNIPGVSGVGERTAVRLLKRFGSLENVLENVDRIGPARVREAVRRQADELPVFKDLARIRTDVPLELELDQCLRRNPDRQKLRELFRRLEFHSLLERSGLVGEAAAELSEDAEFATGTWEELAGRVEGWLDRAQEMAVLPVMAEGRLGGIVTGCAVATPDHAFFLFLGAEADEAVKALFARDVRLLTFEAKPLLVHLLHRGIQPPELAFDGEIALYLLDPSRSRYRLEEAVREYLGLEMPSLSDQLLFDHRTPSEGACATMGKYAQAIFRLRDVLVEKLDQLGLLRLFVEVEVPLCRVLAEMERVGVKVDAQALEDMSKELGTAIDRVAEEVYRAAGCRFNINSPKQLGEVLFERLGLPRGRRTKTGWSTSAAVLEALVDRHQVVGKILEYRQLMKLKSTYVDGIRPLIHPHTGRIHSTFHQTVTATGRISSSEPNLQNIPVRMELGRRIRRLFVPEEGHLFVGGDYSQIELRILAHISGDEALIEAFRKDEDVHRRTAAEVFGVPLDRVTPEMRNSAKAVNFGIVYGMSDYGLARELGISREEAAEYIESYFRRYPGVRQYVQTVVAEAREKGYVTTLMGRRRPMPDLNISNQRIRQFAERTAINTPIQGTAADIIKMAMVRIYRRLRAQGYRARMILQVHDELIFEVPEDEVPAVRELVREEMERVVELRVPLKVDVHVGRSWYHLKEG